MRLKLSVALAGLLIAGCGGGAETPPPGNPAVHARINAMTDCQALQAEFEIAWANYERAPAGSDNREWSSAYVSAINKRMDEIGCYKKK